MMSFESSPEYLTYLLRTKQITRQEYARKVNEQAQARYDSIIKDCIERVLKKECSEGGILKKWMRD